MGLVSELLVYTNNFDSQDMMEACLIIGWFVVYSGTLLIKDPPNKGQLSIEDTCFHPIVTQKCVNC